MFNLFSNQTKLWIGLYYLYFLCFEMWCWLVVDQSREYTRGFVWIMLYHLCDWMSWCVLWFRLRLYLWDLFWDHLWVLGFSLIHLVIRLPVKEPSVMSIVIWDRTMFYVPRRGCLGTWLWEWLAVGVRDPKWSVPG